MYMHFQNSQKKTCIAANAKKHIAKNFFEFTKQT